MAIAISNHIMPYMVKGNPQRDHIWVWEYPLDQWTGNTASVKGEGILFNYIQQISELI